MRSAGIFLSATIFTLALGASASVAQERQGVIQACGSEQSLRQLLGSNGRIRADDCEQINISPLKADGERLCLIDLSPGDAGALERLRNAARSSRYWVRCEDLSNALR